VVIIDALYSAAEGLNEKDTGRASRIMAALLDLARRDHGPAVLVLNNTRRDALNSRGSGVVEDRADITYEMRDMTGYKFNGKMPWHEEVAAIRADAAAWAQKITARKGTNVYRLALCCTKYRDDEEPAPRVLELNQSTEPWTITDVTAEVEHGSAAALQAYQEKEGLACAMLAGKVKHQHNLGAPLTKTAALALLRQHLSKRDAEAMIERGAGKHWRIEEQRDKPGKPKVLRPLAVATAQSFRATKRTPV
jgi:hypothetical protein